MKSLIIQNKAAKGLTASFCIVPDNIEDMSCPYTGDNPGKPQDEKRVAYPCIIYVKEV